MAEVLCGGNGGRDLINAGLGPKTAFPNGILGGVYQTGVLTSLFILFLVPLLVSSSSLPCLFVGLARRGTGVQSWI